MVTLLPSCSPSSVKLLLWSECLDASFYSVCLLHCIQCCTGLDNALNMHVGDRANTLGLMVTAYSGYTPMRNMP